MAHVADEIDPGEVGAATRPPMTEEDALAEARRRWGPRAEIGQDTSTCFDFCLVGERAPGAIEAEWHGIGRSWELAFAEADLRASRV